MLNAPELASTDACVLLCCSALPPCIHAIDEGRCHAATHTSSSVLALPCIHAIETFLFMQSTRCWSRRHTHLDLELSVVLPCRAFMRLTRLVMRQNTHLEQGHSLMHWIGFHISKQFHIEICVCTFFKSNSIDKRVKAYVVIGKINFHLELNGRMQPPPVPLPLSL